MKQEKAQIIFLASLRTQEVSMKMLADYLNKSFDEDIVGIPADYFYAFMKEAIKKAMKITIDMLDEDVSETMKEVKALLMKEKEHVVDIYA